MEKHLWQTLSPMLDQALDLDGDERDEYLGAVRVHDPAAAAALQDLLAAHDRLRSSDFLETSAIPSGDVRGVLEGQTIGAYTLVRPLGMGGMGTVWLANRSDGRFEARVAVKLVNLAVFDAAARDRFTREGTLLARLTHPHIARLYDAGVTSAGQPYLVLEHVDGARIDVYADRERLDLAARLKLFEQVADAVAHAHANLIVHRDLKPSNILVDAAGQVKLLDFGVAKLMEDESGADGTLATRTASALTPRYAAPEQASGGTVTTATDVYALGVLLYELLTGGHPTIRRETDPVAQMRALAEREPARLADAMRVLAEDKAAAVRVAASRRSSIERLRRSYEGDLETVVAKSLKKSPAERYPTVAAFAEDLRRYRHNEPIKARPDSLSYRAKKFVVRHRLGLAAGAGATLALIAGAAMAIVQARESTRQRDLALAELRRAEATNDFSAFLLSAATPATGKPISNADLLARGEALIGKRFARDPELRVHMLLTLADRYDANQQFDARARVVKRAFEESRSLANPGLRAMASCVWAVQFAEKGEYKQALALLDEALPVVAANSDYAGYEGRCRVAESMAAAIANDSTRAVSAAERAVAVESQRGAAPGREFEPLSVLANAYMRSYRYDAANRTFARAVAALEAQGLEATRDGAILLNNWSVMLQETGQMLAAAEASARAVRIAEAIDSENGATLSLLSSYGNALAAIGEYDEAARVLDRSIVQARGAGSPRRLAMILNYAITAASEAGHLERAASLLAEAQQVLKADASATAYSRGLIDGAAARVALARGDAPRAVELADRAVTILKTATPNQASLPSTQVLLARALNAAGRPRDALGPAESSEAAIRARLGGVEHSFLLGHALIEIAAARAALGEHDAARSALSSGMDHLNATVTPKARIIQRARTLQQDLR